MKIMLCFLFSTAIFMILGCEEKRQNIAEDMSPFVSYGDKNTITFHFNLNNIENAKSHEERFAFGLPLVSGESRYGGMSTDKEINDIMYEGVEVFETDESFHFGKVVCKGYYAVIRKDKTFVDIQVESSLAFKLYFIPSSNVTLRLSDTKSKIEGPYKFKPGKYHFEAFQEITAGN